SGAPATLETTRRVGRPRGRTPRDEAPEAVAPALRHQFADAAWRPQGGRECAPRSGASHLHRDGPGLRALPDGAEEVAGHAGGVDAGLAGGGAARSVYR